MWKISVKNSVFFHCLSKILFTFQRTFSGHLKIVGVISSDSLFKDDNARFTMVPLKALSDKLDKLDLHVKNSEN